MSSDCKLAYENVSSNASREGYGFIGRNLELNKRKLKVKRVIAEGGFGYVFLVEDINTGKEYALKWLSAEDNETNENILHEIEFLVKLSGHPNIVRFYSSLTDKEHSEHGKTEYLILTELCTGGPLVDSLNMHQSPLLCSQVVQIFYQICSAVQHMHSQTSPIIHQNLKIENIFLGSDVKIKLCDFHTATMKTCQPDNTWTAEQRSLVEDEMFKNIAPMYRPPEILDTYKNHPINEAMDIWAMGCVLYFLCFRKHPFEDSDKLCILNVNYSIPENVIGYEVLHDLIKETLQLDPVLRPTIDNIIDRLDGIAEAQQIKLDAPVCLGQPTRSHSSSHGLDQIQSPKEKTQDLTKRGQVLCVGEIPFECSEHELIDFLNVQLKFHGLCKAEEIPVVACEIYAPKSYAFLKFETLESAAAAINLDGINFYGQSLKVKYCNDCLVDQDSLIQLFQLVSSPEPHPEEQTHQSTEVIGRIPRRRKWSDEYQRLSRIIELLTKRFSDSDTEDNTSINKFPTGASSSSLPVKTVISTVNQEATASNEKTLETNEVIGRIPRRRKCNDEHQSFLRTIELLTRMSLSDSNTEDNTSINKLPTGASSSSLPVKTVISTVNQEATACNEKTLETNETDMKNKSELENLPDTSVLPENTTENLGPQSDSRKQCQVNILLNSGVINNFYSCNCCNKHL